MLANSYPLALHESGGFVIGDCYNSPPVSNSQKVRIVEFTNFISFMSIPFNKKITTPNI